MADTNHLQAQPPVASDGVSYSGIVWFIVVLTVTTLFCQALVWGMFEIMESRVEQADPARTPLALPIGETPPGPNLLTDERSNLREFRDKEETALTKYGWADQAGQAARIPIERAKDLVLERGLPTRP